MRAVETDGTALARRWYEDLFSRADLAAVDEIVAPDFVAHAPGGQEIRGPEGVKTLLAWYHAIFPDARWTVEDLIAAGDKVVVRARGEGTYAGGWYDIPSAGQRVAETCITIFRVADGMIGEMWFELSDLDVAYQLGAFPPGRE